MVAQLRYSPVYRLFLNGSELPQAVQDCVTGIRYVDANEGAAQVEITLANPDLRFLQQHIRGLSAVAMPSGVNFNTLGRVAVDSVGRASPDTRGLFDMDTTVTLALGYAPDPPIELFTGEITGVAASFPAEGMPGLVITAHDFLQRTTRGSVTRSFGPLPDAAVVAILSVENGLLPLIEPWMIPLDVVNTIGNFLFGTSRKQVHQSDYQLLHKIASHYDMELGMGRSSGYPLFDEVARRYGVEAGIENSTLYLTRFIKQYEPRFSLRYGESLLSFSPRVTSVGQAIGVSKRISLRELRIELVLTVYWDLDRESIGINVLPAIAAKFAPIPKHPVMESEDRTIRNAIDVANTVVRMIHELRRKLNNRLTGSGTCVGDPRIRAGAMVRLEGLGVDFSDNYRITRAVHTLDAQGYRTSFEVQREVLP